MHDCPAISSPLQSPEEFGGLGAGPQLGGGGGGAGSGSGSSGGGGGGPGPGPGEDGHSQWQGVTGLTSGHAGQNGHGTNIPGLSPVHSPPVCGSQSVANARSGTSAVQTSSANAFSRKCCDRIHGAIRSPARVRTRSYSTRPGPPVAMGGWAQGEQLPQPELISGHTLS